MEKPFSELCDIKHGFAFKGEFFTNKGDYVVLTPGNYYESGGYRDRGEKQKYYAGEIPPDYIMKEGEMLVAMTEQAAGLLGSPLRNYLGCQNDQQRNTRMRDECRSGPPTHEQQDASALCGSSSARWP